MVGNNAIRGSRVGSGPMGESEPQAPRVEPYKTHLAYVKERRTDKDGAALLDEALRAMRERGVGGGTAG